DYYCYSADSSDSHGFF
nr:immunoglobulin light chain junction region [Macaca mulatta]